MNIINKLKEINLSCAVVVAKNIKLNESDSDLTRDLKALIITKSQEEFDPELKKGIRDLLKTGGFKPTGRNKPASEYLAQAAREDRFPFINNLVDINNYVSLLSGLPISLLDFDKLSENVLIRQGKEDESYVFNQGGQEIKLKGLICTCSGDENVSIPMGNPIKDSMEGKITENTNSVFGIIYSNNEIISNEKLSEYLEIFKKMLINYAMASQTKTFIL
ncbi:MAG: phenylalanine--tRNA ligase beta subunit-related protein [Pseudomonadota bacterium]